MAVAFASLQHSEENAIGDIIVKMRAAELKRLLGTNSGSFYDTLDKIAASMMGKSYGFSIPDKNDEMGGRFSYSAVITHAEYENGIFEVEFNHHLKEHIKDLKENYTLLSLQRSLRFKNLYSFRLYELMRSKCYPKKGENPNKTEYVIEMDISELKLELGVIDSSSAEVQKVLANQKNPDFDKAISKVKEQMYVEWKDFRDGVIKKACNEINKVSGDMQIKWEKKGAGRGGKVYAIEFTVKYTGRTNYNTEVVDKPKISADKIFEFIDEIREMIEYPLPTKDLAVIAETANYDINKVRNAYEVLEAVHVDVPNVTGFMIKAIKDEYKKPIGKKRKNSFTNFEQQTIDFDELEAKIIDN